MYFIKNTAAYQWTGTIASPVEDLLPVTKPKPTVKRQILTFDDIASGAASQTEEAWIGIKVPNHTKLADARVTKIHGTLPAGVTLKAGVTDTYAEPATAGTPSIVATNNIVANFRKSSVYTSLLTMDTYDATTEEYQFLVLQMHVAATTTAHNPITDIGNSGFPIVEVEFTYESRTSDMNPAGDSLDCFYNGSPKDCYIIDENGDLQLFGCTQNDIARAFNLDVEDLMKGAIEGRVSTRYSGRTNQVSGNLIGQTPYIFRKFLAGTDNGVVDGRRHISISNEWQPVDQDELYLDMMSSKGQRITFRSQNGYVKVNGDQGNDGMFPYVMDFGSDVDIYVTPELVDIHRFQVQYKLT